MTLAAERVTGRSRAERLRAPLVTGASVAAATLALHLRDPHRAYSWGVCPLYAVTGLYCPACGSLRGVNDLGNGHVAQAASSNLLLVLAIPVAVVLYARWSSAAWSGREVRAVPELPPWVKTALLVAVAVFTVARNLPGSWLAP
jgi:hypothetical protein